MIYIVKLISKLPSINRVEKSFINEYMKNNGIYCLYLIKNPVELLSLEHTNQIPDEETYGIAPKPDDPTETAGDQGTNESASGQSASETTTTNSSFENYLGFITMCKKLLHENEKNRHQNNQFINSLGYILISLTMMVGQNDTTVKTTYDVLKQNQEIIKGNDAILKQNQEVLTLSENTQTRIADLCTEIRELYQVARTNQRAILTIIQNYNNSDNPGDLIR